VIGEQRQLFHLLRDVTVPDSSIDLDGIITHSSTTVPAMFAMHWPDGTPCVLVEMYLMDASETITVRSVDGGSLRVLASSLSHLVRYCWKTNKDFHRLDDNTFSEFVTGLCDRNDQNRPKNRNTIRRIIDHCISFLDWIQTHVYKEILIVGPSEQHPRIPLTWRTYTDKFHRTRKRLVYAFTATDDPVDRKGCMPRHIRNRLWDAVAELSSIKAAKSPSLRRGYVRARRELMLAIMEAIGCRPAELATLKVSENADCAFTQTIVIQTLKLRRPEKKRVVKIDFGTALRIESFIHQSREELLVAARCAGLDPQPADRVFLSATNACPVDAPTLERDFNRLAKYAKVSQRACMSMFRHRFITNMMKIHIESYLHERPGGTYLGLSDSDCRTILRRVIPFTGHSQVESIMHYFDIAADEMTPFDYVKAAEALVRSVEASYANICLIASSRPERTGRISAESIDKTRSELQRLALEVRSCIDDFRREASKRQHAK
jgi:integrase